MAAVLFQNQTQGIGCARSRFAMTFSHFGFNRGQNSQHGLRGRLSQYLTLSGVQFGFGGFARFFGLWQSHKALNPQTTQLIGPYGHGWQRRSRVSIGRRSLVQGGIKSVPNTLQLTPRGV